MSGAPADGTALYRIRGENTMLLYIGVSDDFGRRWKEHAKRQPWWSEKRSLSVDCWYESRSEAEAAEAAAIKAEQPKYNKRHGLTGSPQQKGGRQIYAGATLGFMFSDNGAPTYRPAPGSGTFW